MQINRYFIYIIVVINIKLLYLKHILSIKKLFKQKKFLKVLLITQKDVLFYNKHLSIFILPKILKNWFSKTKIFIINDIDFSNKI